jgi:hypothetical protein
MLNLIVVGNPDYYSFFSDSKGEESFSSFPAFESTLTHSERNCSP